jgi:hypothetical protein
MTERQKVADENVPVAKAVSTLTHDLLHQLTKCDNALAMLRSRFPEIADKPDGKLCLDIAEQSCKEMMAIVEARMRHGLLPRLREAEDDDS